LTPKPQSDYGPSLPQLLRPRLRALARWQQAVLIGAALLALVLIGALLIRHQAQIRTYTQSAADARERGLEPITFNFDHARKLRIFKPPGDYVQAEWRSGGTLAASVSVAPFEVRRQTGSAAGALISGWLPIEATRLERRSARAYDHFRLQFEGRARVNRVEGYQYAFDARLPRKGERPRQLFGRIVLLLEPYDAGDPSKDYPPGHGPTRGVKLTMLSTRLDQVDSSTVVGDQGILKRPFRSFRFGT
jgi:hypothetical protein